ncbi:MAG: ribonuclease III [Ignavibacteriae bacterium]|nr:ribonuclease III [Ignavibacteriota bacterium]
MSDAFRTFWRRLFGGSRVDQQVGELSQQLAQARGTGFDFSNFAKTIGYAPRDWHLFIESLLHRSYLPYVSTGWQSNERLEFLGDAVLNFAVAEYLFKMYPEMEEGDLTKLRSRLVNRRILAQRARDINISSFLLLSSSAAQSIEGGSESILSDAFEAVVGAIYMDGGMKAAKKFVHMALLSNKAVMASVVMDDNYKSALLEYTQGRGMAIPRYVTVREEGPDHDRRFTVEVLLGSERYGVGSGKSKKEAEQAAASQALERIQQKPFVTH